jgi:nicotinate-nucleotide--dimethylbenzimidazole phosphoribosyltransferase
MSPASPFADLAARVGLPDEDAAAAGRARLDALAKPTGALGRLEDLAAWVCGVQGACPPRPLRDVRVVVLAADQGVAAATSAYPPQVTAAMVRTFVAGGAAVNVLARQVGARVRVLDLAVDAELDDLGPAVVGHKLRRGSGRIDVEDACTQDEAVAAFRTGFALAEAEVDSGADLLIVGDMGIGNTTPAAVVTGLLCQREVVDVVGRGTGIDDATWMRKAAVVRDAMFRAEDRRQSADLLAAVGGVDLAAAAGFLVGAAARRTPVVLDGVVSAAAALVAHRVAFRAVHWWVAGHRSTEPAQSIALDRLGLVPLVDHGMRLGEGTGALVAVPTLQAAVALLAEMWTLEQVLAAG